MGGAELERPVAEQITSMFDREESEPSPPTGRCWTSAAAPARTLSLWRPGEVTGIDIVPKAVQVASERAREQVWKGVAPSRRGCPTPVVCSWDATPTTSWLPSDPTRPRMAPSRRT